VYIQLTTKTSSREPVTFSIFACFLHIQPAVFQAPDKAVILSEALRRSIAIRGLYGAESKDPGDAYLTHADRSFPHRSRIWQTSHLSFP
jgi:hypothetical protein